MVKTSEVRGAFSEAHTLTYKLLSGGKKPESKKRPATTATKYVQRIMEKDFDRRKIDEGKIKLWKQWYALHKNELKELEFISTPDGRVGVARDDMKQFFHHDFDEIRNLIRDTLGVYGYNLRDRNLPSSTMGEGYTPLHWEYGALIASAIEGIHSGHHSVLEKEKGASHMNTRVMVSELLELVMLEETPPMFAKGYLSSHQQMAAFWKTLIPDAGMNKKEASVFALWLAKKDPQSLKEADDLIDEALINYTTDSSVFLKKAIHELKWKGREPELYKTIQQLKRLLKEDK